MFINMKKRLFVFIVSFSAVFFMIPFCAFASGGYVASKYSDVYHVPDCYHVNDINANNLIWWHTEAEVLATGRKPCSDCRPDKNGSNFKKGETYSWTSESPRTQIAFEQEYANGVKVGYDDGYKDGYYLGEKKGKQSGYVSGFDAGNEEGYSEGFSDGREAGYTEGYQEGYRVGNEKGSEIGKANVVVQFIIMCIFCFIAFYFGKNFKDFKLDERLKKSENDNIELIRVLNKQKYEVHIIDLISEKCNMPSEDFVDNLYINFLKDEGITNGEAVYNLQEIKDSFTESR